MPRESSPSKLGLRCTKLFRLSAWHDAQSRLSVRHSRTSVSQFCRASTSTVTTMVPAPAFSARRARRLGDLPFVGRIELEPDRPAARLDRVLDRGRGDGRQHLQVVAGPGGARDRKLAVLVEGAVGAGRRDARSGCHRSRRTAPCAVSSCRHRPGGAAAAGTSGSPRGWRAASPRRRCRSPCSRNAPAARSCASPARSRRRRAPRAACRSACRACAAPQTIGIGQALFLGERITARQERTGREILQEAAARGGLVHGSLGRHEVSAVKRHAKVPVGPRRSSKYVVLQPYRGRQRGMRTWLCQRWGRARIALGVGFIRIRFPSSVPLGTICKVRRGPVQTRPLRGSRRPRTWSTSSRRRSTSTGRYASP